MSGIAGILHYDGRPIEPAALDRMMQAIAHRGPDGRATRHESGFAVGCNKLDTAPEARVDVPVSSDGELVLAADARLDNRAELASALALTPQAAGDEVLILAAYRRWGEDCPQYLLGDFAFALWDDQQKSLFCARDHFGVKPFYFHVRGKDFAFASEIKALFALSYVSHRIDDARIADFLVGLADDPGATLYAEIRRLPAGHSLTATRAGFQIRRYWQIEPRNAPSGDPAQLLRHAFLEAVRCRLRDAAPVGAMLSGGLDSSSVACVARTLLSDEDSLPLRTFSLVFDKTPALSERPFIEAVLSSGGFDPFFVDGGDYAPFSAFDRILAEQDGLFPAPGLALSQRLYHAAAAAGVRVLLDGHGGDEVISHGHGRLDELAREGRWVALWRETSGASATFGHSNWELFGAYVKRYGAGRRLSRVRQVAARALGRRAPAVGERPTWCRAVNPELVARTDLIERYRAMRRADAAAAGDEQLRHARLLGAPRVSRSFEVLDHAAAAAGTEARYPFWDKRLVELCLSLPSEEKLRSGWPRFVLRRAMDGLLPAAVQWRRDKLDFGPHLVRGMLTRHGDMLDRVLHGTGGVGAYVDRGAVATAAERVAARPEVAGGSDIQTVWRTIALALWLEYSRRTSEAAA